MANLHQLIMGKAFESAINSATSERESMQALALYAQKQALDRVEKEKAAKIEQERIAKNNDIQMAEMGGGSLNTDQSRVNNGLEKNIKYATDPKTGEIRKSIVWDTQSRAELSTIAKNEMEIKNAQGFQKSVQSGMDSREIAKLYPGMAKEISDLEELGVIGPNGASVQSVGSGIPSSGVNTIGEDGRIVRPQKSDNVITEVTPQGRPDKVISKSGKIEEGKINTIQKVQEEQTKEAVKSIRSFNRIKSAAQGLVSAGKRIIKEQGGFGWKQIITGKAKRFIAKSGFTKVSPEDAQAGMAEYRGQVKETVLALSPILTNQNRIIQGVVDMLSETLWDPNKPSTGTEFTAQLRQTSKNAYKLSKALNTGLLSAGEISDLQENSSIDDIKKKFKQILNKSSWTLQDEKDFEEEWKEIINVPASTPEDLFNSSQGANANKYGL